MMTEMKGLTSSQEKFGEKVGFVFFLFVLILSLLTMPQKPFILPVTAKIWIVDDDGSAHYDNIQEAVDRASPGDTIFVKEGIYYEHVVVDKALVLTGENRTAVIHGGTVGYGIRVVTNNVSILEFTVRRFRYGISMESIGNCTLRGNAIMECEWGIQLFNSCGNILRNNNMTGNDYNFGVGGVDITVSKMMNDVDTSNTVDGKAIYYLVNEHNVTLDSSTSPRVGYLVVVNSTNIVVRNLTLDHNRHGIIFFSVKNSSIDSVHACENLRGLTLWLCSNCTIIGNVVINNAGVHSASIEILFSSNISAYNNTVEDSEEGFMLYSSENCWVSRNVVKATTYGIGLLYSNNSLIQKNIMTKNVYGISVGYSTNNTIVENSISQNNYGIAFSYLSIHNTAYHNNLEENTYHVIFSETGYPNTWDNGFEGNYWSDYTGVDLNHDGIGDISHEIDFNNIDNFPLMGIFHSFNTPLGFYTNVISNSTIEDFEYFEFNGSIRMHISNQFSNHACGFCRMCIPKDLISPPYSVIIDDGLAETIHFNFTIHDNYTHRWIYFAYQHPTHKVEVIPELRLPTTMLLLMTATLLVASLAKRSAISRKFAVIELKKDGTIDVEWHDTHEIIGSDSLRQIYGIGPITAEKLIKSGIKTVGEFINCKDLTQLSCSSNLSKKHLGLLQLRGRSMLQNEVYQIAPFNIDHEKAIFFDIETDIACKKVWVIGLQVNGQFTRLYADDWEQEKEILVQFAKILADNPDCTLISFSGTNFDYRITLSAMQRHGMNTGCLVSHSHIDLGILLRRCFIFPNQRFALKDLGSFLKYPFRNPDLDGLAVALAYHRHAEEGKPLDNRILEYNEDDVKVLPFLVSKAYAYSYETEST